MGVAARPPRTPDATGVTYVPIWAHAAMALVRPSVNPVRSVKPLRITTADGVALDRDETRALLAAVRDHRLGAAVAMLVLQGWRVSEVLGLAWEDVDLDAGTALVRRASVYVDGRGQQLGPPRPRGRAASTG